VQKGKGKGLQKSASDVICFLYYRVCSCHVKWCSLSTSPVLSTVLVAECTAFAPFLLALSLVFHSDLLGGPFELQALMMIHLRVRIRLPKKKVSSMRAAISHPAP